jgi:hypothetical protein
MGRKPLYYYNHTKLDTSMSDAAKFFEDDQFRKNKLVDAILRTFHVPLCLTPRSDSRKVMAEWAIQQPQSVQALVPVSSGSMSAEILGKSWAIHCDVLQRVLTAEDTLAHSMLGG